MALAMLAAGCTAPSEPLEQASVSGGSGQGGGDVSSTSPEWQAFSGSLTNADNSGSSVEVFTGRVFEPNSERDVHEISVVPSGVVTGSHVHTVTASEARAESEPASYGADGFKVWSATNNDGVLHFKFRFTYPLGTPVGAATFTPNVKDQAGRNGAGVDGPVDSTTLVFFSLITVAPDPVGPTGAATPGSWGQWSAQANGANVESANFIRLTNTGQKPAAELVLDFTEDAFVGADDANFSITIADNVEFAVWEDISPSSTAPNQGTYAWQTANADGSVTLSFSGLGNIVYVKYRIKSLPSVLAAQSYGASYTATEL